MPTKSPYAMELEIEQLQKDLAKAQAEQRKTATALDAERTSRRRFQLHHMAATLAAGGADGRGPRFLRADQLAAALAEMLTGWTPGDVEGTELPTFADHKADGNRRELTVAAAVQLIAKRESNLLADGSPAGGVGVTDRSRMSPEDLIASGLSEGAS